MTEEKAAIFIDAENLIPWMKSDGPDQLLKSISTFGQAIVRRAYGKWTNHHLSPYQGELNRLGFELIHLYHPVTGKNSSDIQMTVDIMEYAWRVKEIRWFVLATGDSDFSPLFRRLRELGKEVIGVGPPSALSESVKSSCSRFIYTELANLKDRVILQSAFDDIADLVETVLRTFDGPANCSALKEKISNVDSAFDEKSLGYSSFTALLKDLDGITVTYDSKTTTWFASFSSEQLSEVQPFSKNSIHNSDHTRPISKEDQYGRILRKKSWQALPKQKLLKVFKVARSLDPLTKNDMIYKIIECIEGDVTAADVRKALTLFFKARSVNVLKESENERLWQLKDIEAEDIIKSIDEAMLSRLIAGCKEANVEVSLDAFKPFLIGNYTSANIGEKVRQISKAIDERLAKGIHEVELEE